MSTNNTSFYTENQGEKKQQHKNIAWASFGKSFTDLFFFFFLSVSTLSIGREIFYHKFVPYFLKT